MQRHNHEQQEEERAVSTVRSVVQLIPDAVEAFFHIMSKCVCRWLAPKPESLRHADILPKRLQITLPKPISSCHGYLRIRRMLSSSGAAVFAPSLAPRFSVVAARVSSSVIRSTARPVRHSAVSKRSRPGFRVRQP